MNAKTNFLENYILVYEEMPFEVKKNAKLLSYRAVAALTRKLEVKS